VSKPLPWDDPNSDPLKDLQDMIDNSRGVMFLGTAVTLPGDPWSDIEWAVKQFYEHPHPYRPDEYFGNWPIDEPEESQ